MVFQFSILRRKKKDDGCIFYHNIMRTLHSPLSTKKATFIQYLSLYARFESFRTFLCIFVSVVKVFVR